MWFDIIKFCGNPEREPYHPRKDPNKPPKPYADKDLGKTDYYDKDKWAKDYKDIESRIFNRPKETPEQEKEWEEQLRRDSEQPVDMSDEIEMNTSKCCEKTVQEFMRDEFDDIREMFPVWSQWVKDVGRPMNADEADECDELKQQLEEISRYAFSDLRPLPEVIKEIISDEPAIDTPLGTYTVEEIRRFVEVASLLLRFWERCEENSSTIGEMHKAWKDDLIHTEDAGVYATQLSKYGKIHWHKTKANKALEGKEGVQYESLATRHLKIAFEMRDNPDKQFILDMEGQPYSPLMKVTVKGRINVTSWGKHK